MINEGVTKSENKWRVTGGSNVYGGHLYNIQFEKPCTREDCNEVANTPGWCCYFGYGLWHGKIGDKFVVLKIYND